MKTKLTKAEQATIIPHIQGVLKTGMAWNDEGMHHPAGAIIDAVLTIEGVKKSNVFGNGNGKGFDANGWQWDWWQKFSYKGKKYTLSGSGYYGGHSFSPADE